MNTPTSGDEYVAETVLRLNNLGLHSASELVESQAATIARLRFERESMALALADAAAELPQTAGPIATRIRVYRAAHSDECMLLRKEIENLKSAIEYWRGGSEARPEA